MSLRVLSITLVVMFGLTVAEAQQQVVEYPIPSGAKPGNVCAEPNHPDGTLGSEWFVANASIGKIDTQTLQMTEYPQLGMTSGLVGCSFSPTGILYFANQRTFNVYAFDPKTLSVTTIPVPPPNSSMAGMTWHSDGLLYIMVSGSNVIRRLRADNTWASTISLPAGSFPHGPSSCADGNVWFAMNTANRLAYVTPAGVVGLGPDGKPGFVLPQPNSAPFTTACVDWDNRTYYTLMAANKIAAIDRTTFQIQQWDVIGTTPKGIAIGDDSNVYVALSATNQIGIMTLGGGSVVRTPVPTPYTSPNKLGVGPDRLVWGGEHDRANFFSVAGSGTSPSSISVEVTPTIVSLQMHQQFTAQITNSAEGVTWTVTPAIGHIDSNGLFTATGVGTGTVTAISVEDPSKTASVTVTVR